MLINEHIYPLINTKSQEKKSHVYIEIIFYHVKNNFLFKILFILLFMLIKIFQNNYTPIKSLGDFISILLHNSKTIKSKDKRVMETA